MGLHGRHEHARRELTLSRSRREVSSEPAPAREVLEVDTTLLEGFTFTCRPDCGLCCYTTPAVTPGERARLVQIEPHFPVLEPAEEAPEEVLPVIAARPHGGACHFLEGNRCRVHAARPFPCRTFPLHVTLGPRVQATVVLSCPGVGWGDLARWSRPRPRPSDAGPSPLASIGLDGELGAVREELLRPETAERLGRTSARWAGVLRRVRRTTGEEELGALMERLARDPPRPGAADLPIEPPPSEEARLEELPLTFLPNRGVVALRGATHGWEVIALRADGEEPEVLAVYPEPTEIPRATPEATRLLRGYLSYVASRDVFLSLALARWAEDPIEAPTVQEIAEAMLKDLALQALGRAQVLARLHGHPSEPLGPGEVEAGIRAIDMDFLDQAALGESL